MNLYVHSVPELFILNPCHHTLGPYILELGEGFAFVGRQFHLDVGSDFYGLHALGALSYNIIRSIHSK